MRARSFADRCFHSGKARSAAAIARRVSAAPIRGTSAITSPVAGFVTGKVSPDSASTHFPSMYACRCRRAGSTVVTAQTIIEHMEAQFVRLDAVRAFELADGVTGQPLFGEGAMLNLIRFEPGAVVPLHSHPHEQLGIVLEGMQALVVDGVAHELGPMEAYVLPGGVEHSAYCGPDGALVLDVFTPVREDYRGRWEAIE